jgi:integrase
MVGDFYEDERGAIIKNNEKGDKRRTIGLHHRAAEAIREYMAKAELTGGPLLRPQDSSRRRELRLAERPFTPTGMYNLLAGYLACLPKATREQTLPDGSIRRSCIYSPHSLRAIAASLLLDRGEGICKVQELLGHRHVTTTQIYDKRRRQAHEGASHAIPL